MCEAGELVVIPPGVLHGFRVFEETVLEVVAEYDIGTLYPVTGHDGQVKLVEVHRPDMPWGRPPNPGQGWTTDAEMRAVLDRLAEPRVLAYRDRPAGSAGPSAIGTLVPPTLHLRPGRWTEPNAGVGQLFALDSRRDGWCGDLSAESLTDQDYRSYG